MAEQSEPGFSHLRIVVPFKLKCRHNGIDYAWPKGGEAVNMPIESAEHCFGFGLDDKARAFHRLGWLTTSDTFETAQAKLDQIQFHPVRQVFEIQTGRRGRPRNISNDRSLANAGGAEGQGSETPNPGPNGPDDDDEDDEVSAEAL